MATFDAQLVRDAFIWAQPLAEVYRQLSLQQANQGPNNRLMAFRNLADARFRAVPSPNNDTLYTVFAFDLSQGPVVIQTPEIPKDRYFVLPFYDSFTNVFASFGTRTKTYGPLNLLLTPPGFRGEIPAGFQELKSPSIIGCMLGRILVADEADLPAVRAIQDQFVVQPLNEWLDGVRSPLIDFERPEPVQGLEFFDARYDMEGFWKGAGEILAGAPVPPEDLETLASFAPLGLTQDGFTMPTDPEDKALLLAETEKSWKFLADFTADPAQAAEQGVNFFDSNGWGWSASVRDAEDTGSLFYGQEYLLRAWVNYLYYGMLPPEEALYPANYNDSDGNPLHGEHSYTWVIPGGNRPVKDLGFTSVTLYDMEGYFYDNPQKVYKIGDRDKDLSFDENGDLVITISAERPEGAANWLPAPKDQNFYLMYRNYLPIDEVLEGTYQYQPIHRIK